MLYQLRYPGSEETNISFRLNSKQHLWFQPFCVFASDSNQVSCVQFVHIWTKQESVILQLLPSAEGQKVKTYV